MEKVTSIMVALISGSQFPGSGIVQAPSPTLNRVDNQNRPPEKDLYSIPPGVF